MSYLLQLALPPLDELLLELLLGRVEPRLPRAREGGALALAAALLVALRDERLRPELGDPRRRVELEVAIERRRVALVDLALDLPVDDRPLELAAEARGGELRVGRPRAPRDVRALADAGDGRRREEKNCEAQAAAHHGRAKKSVCCEVEV